MDTLQRGAIPGDLKARAISQLSYASTAVTSSNQLKIGTWNVRGANNDEKRRLIDEHLSSLTLSSCKRRNSQQVNAERNTTHG